MTRNLIRLTPLALCAALLLMLAAPAYAHVTANPNAAPAGGYFMAKFRVGHGCDGEPTKTVRIAIPDGVSSVRPEVVPGWEIETVIGELSEPIESHGQTITEGVREIVFSGGSLPDEHFQDFGVNMRMPDGADGDVLWFPVIQECDGAEEAWINIPDSVEAWNDIDYPAPYITLSAGSGGHGGDDDEADDVVAEPISAETELASAAAEEDGGSDLLPILALVAGLGGLLLGGAALVSARRTS